MRAQKVLRVTFRVLTGASGVGVMEVPFTVGDVYRRLRNGIRIQGWGAVKSPSYWDI